MFCNTPLNPEYPVATQRRVAIPPHDDDALCTPFPLPWQPCIRSTAVKRLRCEMLKNVKCGYKRPCGRLSLPHKKPVLLHSPAPWIHQTLKLKVENNYATIVEDGSSFHGPALIEIEKTAHPFSKARQIKTLNISRPPSSAKRTGAQQVKLVSCPIKARVPPPCDPHAIAAH